MGAKQKLLKNLGNTYCRLKPSNVGGVGVFAIRDIPRGVNPFCIGQKQKWIKFNINELEKLDSGVLEMVSNFFVVHKNGVVYISESGLNGLDPSYFLNDSCQPNMETIDDGANFISLRDIKKGEELFVSYATYDENYKK